VEVLASYSHTTQLADLQRCAHGRSRAAPPTSHTTGKRAWSLRDRLDERTRVDLIDAYRAGATAASLAHANGLSLRSVKRLVSSAGVRREQTASVTARARWTAASTQRAPRATALRRAGPYFLAVLIARTAATCATAFRGD
jgi:hypothetical protein